MINSQNEELARNHFKVGVAAIDSGDQKLAREMFELTLDLCPNFIDAHYGLSILKKYTLRDKHISDMEDLRKTIYNQVPEIQFRYWFTLGKMYEDVGEYEQAFLAYREGNRLKYVTILPSGPSDELLVNRTKNFFNKDFFNFVNEEEHKVTPVFIVGMPRSGSTLIEQILDSHPDVYGAGETSALAEVVGSQMPKKLFQHYPEVLKEFPMTQYQAMGRDYMQRMTSLAPGAKFIVDKMSPNFFYLGVIKKILPHAKIIHSVRNPMDTCFSCYSRLFINNNLGFTYNLMTLGKYYHRYRNLMQFWEDILPKNSIYSLQYEKLINNQVEETKKLVSHLGLPWDDELLQFHKNGRIVKTSSQVQVRQPIYKSSQDRWERFKPYLEELQGFVQQYL
jgi:tetratricopeptide (TPR) repeat protein